MKIHEETLLILWRMKKGSFIYLRFPFWGFWGQSNFMSTTTVWLIEVPYIWYFNEELAVFMEHKC